MTLCIARRLFSAVALLLMALATPSFGQAGPGQVRSGRPLSSRPTPPPGPPWWKDEQFKKDLGLTGEESARIDSIYQATLPQLRQGYDELDKAEDKLSHMIEKNADEALVTRQIEQVEAIRSNLNKTRTLMHLHMRQVLTPEQRLRFTALYEQRQAAQQARQQRPPTRQDH
jgi:periplasmic protein CpxP/Spy